MTIPNEDLMKELSSACLDSLELYGDEHSGISTIKVMVAKVLLLLKERPLYLAVRCDQHVDDEYSLHNSLEEAKRVVREWMEKCQEQHSAIFPDPVFITEENWEDRDDGFLCLLTFNMCEDWERAHVVKVMAPGMDDTARDHSS